MKVVRLLLMLILSACGQISLEDLENAASELETSDVDSSLSNLALSFDEEDLNTAQGMLNPFGVIRHEQDNGHGHGGLDIPLVANAPLYAVKSGTLYKKAPSVKGGYDLWLLIHTGLDAPQTGWVFIMEGVVPTEGIYEGALIQVGAQIAKVQDPAPYTVHLELAQLTVHGYTKNKTCWANHLSSKDSGSFGAAFAQYIVDVDLATLWQAPMTENRFPFADLLDADRFSSEPELCYNMGTDVRR